MDSTTPINDGEGEGEGEGWGEVEVGVVGGGVVGGVGRCGVG